MTNDFTTEENKDNTGTPVCEKCGSVLIKESLENTGEGSFGSAQDKPHVGMKQEDSAVWVCPQCQGEIDFMGEDEDE